MHWSCNAPGDLVLKSKPLCTRKRKRERDIYIGAGMPRGLVWGHVGGAKDKQEIVSQRAFFGGWKAGRRLGFESVQVLSTQEMGLECRTYFQCVCVCVCLNICPYCQYWEFVFMGL